MSALTFDTVLAELSQYKREELAAFSAKLTPNAGTVLGVSVKDIRAVAKAHKSEYDTIFGLEERGILEISLLKCAVLGLACCGIDKKCEYIESLAKGFGNWQQTDILASSLRIKPKEQARLFETASRLAIKEGEFEARQGLVLILARLIERERLQEIFTLLNQVKYGKYYTDMAAAWLISTLYVKYSEQTKDYLFGNNKLSPFTYKKAIQKTIESYRIPPFEKAFLRTKRR